MPVTARAPLTAAGVLTLAAGVLTGAAGCGGGAGPAPAPTALIDATTMRGALLQANEIGPAWAAPAESADPGRTVSLCGGTTTAPAVPPGATVVAAPLADEGERGAQSLDQTALVYPGVAAAGAAQAALRAVADGCPATVSVPATRTADRDEPAYTETVTVRPLEQGRWKGFAVLRHKRYEAAHPGTADTAVVILNDRNVVLVDAYAVYRLGAASAGPEFDSDWQKLVGSVVQRVT